MKSAEREALLARWIKPSSDDEVERQERALRMVRAAIAESDALEEAKSKIYAKGSYANNMNVRLDSDVDIVVECHKLFYWDYASYVTPPSIALPSNSYIGKWTPKAWRKAVIDALVAKFGAADVDTTGSVAIAVSEKPGSRPSIDVVPSFHYRRYTKADKSAYHDGSCVFPKEGKKIVNWPDQQLKNGRAKNDRTSKRYKDFVRALKNAENQLVVNGSMDELASYIMECLVWNVDDTILKTGERDEAFRSILIELWQGLKDKEIYKEWVEPNKLKYMFRGKKKWTDEEARQLILETWKLLEYDA